MSSSKKKTNLWKLLSVLGNETRVKMIRLLLQFEWRSLSEIARQLEQNKCKMTLPGVLKHMRELEATGLVRRESGAFTAEPDARKTIYILEGKERVEKIMDYLEAIKTLLETGLTFGETAKLARRIQGMRQKPKREELERLNFLLEKCESKKIRKYLTEDEMKKVKLWKMMLSLEQVE